MAAPSFQVLIGTALVDTDFRKALLNGSRRKILQTFPFTSDEIETMMAIRAESLEQFASELHAQLIAPTVGFELEPLPRLRRIPRYAERA